MFIKAIGIFGGTFNPPHLGHLSVAKSFLESTDADRLFIIPAGTPPHKEYLPDVSNADRINMAEMTFFPLGERAVISDFEIKRGGKSYTWKTVNHFAKEYPDCRIYLIIGSDMLRTFSRWVRFEEILKRVTLVPYRRSDDDGAAFEEAKKDLERRFGADILCLDKEIVEVSSSEVRASLERGEGHPCLTKEVVDYIKENGLYQKDETPALKELLRERLSKERFEHTVNVMHLSARLAAHYGENVYKAKLAGLLHDATKEITEEEHFALCREAGEPLLESNRQFKKVLHALSAPSYLRLRLGIEDEEVLNAVRWHTTARADMTMLEKIVYLADYAEEGRSFPRLEEIRALLFTDIDRAVLSGLEMTVEKLKKIGAPIHPQSVEAYEFYKEKNERQAENG